MIVALRLPGTVIRNAANHQPGDRSERRGQRKAGRFHIVRPSGRCLGPHLVGQARCATHPVLISGHDRLTEHRRVMLQYEVIDPTGTSSQQDRLARHHPKVALRALSAEPSRHELLGIQGQLVRPGWPARDVPFPTVVGVPLLGEVDHTIRDHDATDWDPTSAPHCRTRQKDEAGRLPRYDISGKD